MDTDVNHRSQAGHRSGSTETGFFPLPRGAAVEHLCDVSPGVAGLASAVDALVDEGVLPVGLAAGDRPAADVAALMSALARIEAVLATRMAAAEAGGALPFLTAGGMASHSYWSRAWARALSRAGRLANERPDIADAWLKGAITCEHVDVAAKGVTGLEPEKASTVLDGLTPLWGRAAPSTVATYCARARTIVDPPSADEDVAAQKAHEARFLSFSVLDDTVHIAGALARLEGEMLMNVLHATAEKTRVAGDGLTRSQRRADALIQLAAAQPMEGHGAGGGPAISVTVTSGLGAVTGSGHALTDDETRFALCDPAIATLVTEGSVATPCATRDPSREGAPGAASGVPGGAEPAAPPAELRGPDPGTPDAHSAAGCAGLAALTAQALNSPQPLALGRTQRVASASQRRALAVRDGGCIMPGCEVKARHCQIHHLEPWTAGGCTDLPNLVSLCWAHHRQVDLGRWDIRATESDNSAVDDMTAGDGCPPDRRPGIDGASVNGRLVAPGDPFDGRPANHGAPFTVTVRPRGRWRPS